MVAIAVLPFDDLSPGSDQAWLANGMAEALIDSLSRIDALRIPGRRSTTRLKSEGADVRRIGDRLQVGTVLDGSVQLFGERLIVVAQWIRVADETLLWSRRFEVVLDDVFDVQQEISVNIAERIRTDLGIEDAQDWLLEERYRVGDIRAWELVRRASDLIWTGEDEDKLEAIRLLSRAIEIEPNYPTPHAMLARVYALSTASQSAAADLQRAANRALELDPMNATAHWALAMQSVANWEFEAAEARLKTAIAANPSDNSLAFPYTDLLWSTGRLQEALAEAQRVVNLEPLWSFKGKCYSAEH